MACSFPVRLWSIVCNERTSNQSTRFFCRKACAVSQHRQNSGFQQRYRNCYSLWSLCLHCKHRSWFTNYAHLAQLEQYQEQPQLLDPHLEEIISPCMDYARNSLRSWHHEMQRSCMAESFPFKAIRDLRLHTVMKVSLGCSALIESPFCGSDGVRRV